MIVRALLYKIIIRAARLCFDKETNNRQKIRFHREAVAKRNVRVDVCLFVSQKCNFVVDECEVPLDNVSKSLHNIIGTRSTVYLYDTYTHTHTHTIVTDGLNVFVV